jgi:membrane protein YdbS with pleckstrin-like domain
MSLERQRIIWLIVFLLLILAAFIIPFTPLLQGLSKIYGAFLFWNVFALVVISGIVVITARWRDDHER